MTRPFIACHNFDLDLVFKVTMIIESFDLGSFLGGANCNPWDWKIFIMSVDTSIEDLPKIHQPDLFDLCQGHSTNRLFNGNQCVFT